jgi:hypothetical protein
MVDSITEKSIPNRISRRAFLKIALAGIGATGIAYFGLDKLDKSDTLEIWGSKLLLLEDIRAGKFNLDKLPPISTIEDLKKEIASKTEALKGVSAAGVCISDIGQNTYFTLGNDSEKFTPGSLIKIPLMYQVWLRGKSDGIEYLTQENADKILDKSEYSGDFIMQLPFNRNRKKEDLYLVISEMLINSQIPPEMTKDGNIKVDLLDYFNFLRKTDFPPVMKNAMRKSEKDDDDNFGVSKVLRNSGKDIYFKIGLTKEGEEFVNSYAIILGENIKAVGYAKGINTENVIKQMLDTAAAIAKYSHA